MPASGGAASPRSKESTPTARKFIAHSNGSESMLFALAGMRSAGLKGISQQEVDSHS